MEINKKDIIYGLQLLSDNANYKIECDRYLLRLHNFNDSDFEGIKNILLNAVRDPSVTEFVARCFPAHLLWILTESMKKYSNFHQQNCLVLAKLLTKHPDVLKFSLQYFDNNPSPFHNESEEQSPPKRAKLNLKEYKVTDYDIVYTCWSFLKHATDQFKDKWDWSKFIILYSNSSNDLTKWLCYQCIAILFGKSDADLNLMYRNGNINAQKLSIEFDTLLSTSFNVTQTNSPGIHKMDITDKDSLIVDIQSVVKVHDILLPKRGPEIPASYPGGLVSVNSTNNNLRSLALAVTTGRPACLSGPVGSGKTSLIEHLSRVTGTKLVKVQLGEQTDSKMLLGSYRCTDVPGEFLWEPGVLTQAVIAGDWLLLEDVDSATLDVSSVLAGLIETGTLNVPGYKDQIRVTPGFQLFLTQRLITSSTGFHKRTTGSSCLLEKNLLQVYIEPLSRSELITVVTKLFPVLNTIATRIVDVFLLFSVGSHDYDDHSVQQTDGLALGSGRLTSTRDLIKWCCRMVTDFDISSENTKVKILQDAIDVFCCSVVLGSSRLELAKSVAAKLGATDNFAELYCNLHTPSVRETSSELIVGRAIIPRKINEIISLTKKSITYSFTNPTSRLLERIASCISIKEPILLVGETGTGKTSSVQYLAERTGRKLIVINMNQQSDSVDLLGGYKPVDLKYIIGPIRDEFEDLFRNFYNQQKNQKFLGYIDKTFYKSDWKSLVIMMKKCQITALSKLTDDELLKNCSKTSEFLKRWRRLGLKIKKLEMQLRSKASLAFSFIEGSLVKAIQNGDWVLLDEINLAPAETLECLSGLLEGTAGSLSLLERGDRDPVKRHSDFTLFACMNPATDVGKKDLPAGLRNRFTEFYVDELTNSNDLIVLVSDYLRPLSKSVSLIKNVVKLYLTLRKESKLSLCDGTGHKPHYSLRTLCRALSISQNNPCGSLARSLYEALCISFLTQLDHASHSKVESMIAGAVLGKESSSLLGQPLPEQPVPCVKFEGYWVPLGLNNPDAPKNYVLTESVKQNLRDLARVVSIGKLPVLLQGDTSVGKTSLITYLARASGNQCVRINNHEHTDLQEYIGSYVADEKGALVFREGILVQAMRKGYWVILDELNLAPSDVLEALNRVLDDNRELFVPETQTTVKAHPGFMLFATQNPPGLYGGRKMLSRAFRNRFVELHFSEIPPNELQVILSERCHIPPSYSKKMIAVMTELQLKRRGSAACAGKQGFITLRDLFRWGERYRLASDTESGKYYDWDQHIADEGYLVLAGRVRQPEERGVIQEVIKKHIKRTVDTHNLFTLHEKTSTVTRDILENLEKLKSENFKHVVWTKNMRRLVVLIGKAFRFKEPVLLVGETGCGKTTVCQVLASRANQNLKYVNCHLHTEASDFLGGLRPTRDKKDSGLFEWVDGPLVEAMRNGDLFLADEISLADDSVLERLNSLLEPERRLLLSEKNIDESKDSCEVAAVDSFHFTATMNPAGDFGKKELSPALRNRFTEIWCDSVNSREDYLSIIEHNLLTGLSFGNQQDGSSGIGNCILNFIEWFASTTVGSRFSISVRDILTWVQFINTCSARGLTLAECFVHGACLTFLDSLGSGVSASESLSSLTELRNTSVSFLLKQLEPFGLSVESVTGLIYDEKNNKISADISNKRFEIKPFYINLEKKDDLEKMEVDGIEVNGEEKKELDTSCVFSFTAPTTGMNTLRLLRGMQLGKAILLEGSPGVGKTSLVSAVAKATGNELLRINLSDQTDVSDLFGADLPAEGENAGKFAWRDGPFLQALKQGHWILLDELNLAPQSVLEGLNACLDHRGEVFVPELGKVFQIKTGTRIFACQNPLKQGGARRGLPRSFLNRFTQVYIDCLSPSDLEFIATNQYPEIPIDIITKMIKFNSRLERDISELKLFGYNGSPWEMNLRDILRWCQALKTFYGTQNCINPGKFVDLIYIDRMRTSNDKNRVKEIFYEIFGTQHPLCNNDISFYITDTTAFIGDCQIRKKYTKKNTNDNFLILRKQLPVLRLLSHCVNFNWMTILVGNSGTGKTSCVRLLAQICNRDLKIVSVNSAMDTTEILGGFEQTDYHRHLQEISEQVDILLKQLLCKLASTSTKLITEGAVLLGQWEEFQNMIKNTSYSQNKTTTEETKDFQNRVTTLCKVLGDMRKCNNNSDLVIDESINNMLRKLTLLSAGVKQENSLNAGGKFEWVDSVLVKCLINGSWLLLDNVNLCSAAVLDRLNGLLEPNGYLTISERGVNSFGELITIKPHPDFRLFLAMDSRYGEISRAMRNRGIEICILPDDNFDLLDQKSLLANVGLEQHNFQGMLLQIHNSISEILPEYLKPTTTQLLHAGFLVSQQVLRGVDVTEALQLACIDVYVKAKGDILESSIKEEIKDLLATKIVNTDHLSMMQNTLNVKALTLNTTSITDNCTLAIVKQQLELFSSLLKWSFNKTTDFKNNLQNIFPTELSFDNLDANKLLSFMFLISYQMSSEYDANIRFLYIDQLINQISKSDKDTQTSNSCILYKSLNKTIFDILKRIGSSNRTDELPIDFRYYSQILYKNSYDVNYINKFTLLMYFNIVKSAETSLAKNVNKESKTITVSDYSNAVLAKKLNDILEVPVVKNFSKILHAFDKYITELLLDSSTVLSTEDYTNAYAVLNWRFRLHKLGDLVIIDRTNKEYDASEVIAELSVHYKWFIKYCIYTFESLLSKYGSFNNDVNIASLDLKNILNEVSESLKTTIVPLQGIGTRYKCVSGEVLPYYNIKQAELFARYKNVNQMLSIWTKIDQIHINSTNSRIQFLCTEEGKRSRIQLLDIYNNLLENNFEKAQELLQIIEEKLNDKINTIAINITDKNYMEIQLWSVKEYYLLMFLNLYKKDIADAISGEIVFDYNKHSSLVKALTTSQQQIPSHFVNLLTTQSYTKPILNEILDSITQFSIKSTCLLPNKFLQRNTEDILREEIPLSKHNPLLTRIITEILSSSNKSLESLGMSHERKEQLIELNKLLWNNMIVLNNYNSIIHDAVFTVKLFMIFINDLKEILDVSNDNSGDEIITQCIVNINKLYEDSSDKAKDEKNKILDALKQCSVIVRELSDSLQNPIEEDNEWAIKILYKTAQIQMQLSFLKATFCCNLNLIDPIHKQGLKLKYTKEEKISTSNYLLAGKMQHYILTGNLKYPEHDQFKEILQLQNKLITLEEELEKKVAVRPVQSYPALAKDCLYLSESLLSPTSVLGLYNKLTVCVNILYEICFENKEKGLLNKSNIAQILGEVSSWIYSLDRFSEKLNSSYDNSYPDITRPLMAAINSLIEGASNLKSVIMKLINTNETLLTEKYEIINNLMCFPMLNDKQTNTLNIVNNLTSENMYNMLVQNINEHDVERHRMLLSCLEELKNHCVASNSMNNAWNSLKNVLEMLVISWKKQEKNREQKKIDEDNLYITKTKCEELTEDETIMNEIQEIFPSFDNADFSDFKDKSLDAKKIRDIVKPFNNSLITVDDIKVISSIHMDLMTSFTKSEWIIPSKVEMKKNYLVPLTQRYQTFQLLINNLIRGLDNNLDKHFITSLNILTTATLKNAEGVDMTIETPVSPTRSKFDFYSESKVEEAKRGLSILQNVLVGIEKQLEEWPEHPVLNDVVVIIKRIISFSVTSPLARFLTGVELLRDKVEEWNKNAHRGNNLQPESLELAQLIVDWRKMELNCWRDSLNNVLEKHKSGAHKYWFHVYSLIEQYIEENADNAISFQELSTSLKQFLEKSTLGEYVTRLNLIYVFHCHVTHLNPCPKRDELIALLWNLYNYYSQFISNVETRIKDQRTPIEKKLRDFVKISSWEKDLSYWGVKDRVDKAHKALHKYIKEFRECLQQMVTSSLVDNKAGDNATIGIWDRPHRQSTQYKYMLEPSNYVANKKLKRFVPDDHTSDKLLINTMKNLFGIARNRCNDTILLCSYPCRLQTLDTLLTEIIERSTHLRNLEVSSELPKPKQKSQAKNILQQKRKALADLFKSLYRLGLSHRTGLHQANLKDHVLSDFSIAPIDLEAAFSYLKTKKCDGPLLTVWEGCEMYYVRSVARYAALDTAIKSPAQDLGIQNIERCKGYSADLLILAQTQKANLAQNSRVLCNLRKQLNQMLSLEESYNHPKQSNMQNSYEKLKDILVTTTTVMEQFELVLKSCPEENQFEFSTADDDICIDSSLSDLPMLKSRKNDLCWNETMQQVKAIISNVAKIQNTVDKNDLNIPMTFKHNTKDILNIVNFKFVSPILFEVIIDSFDQLLEVSNKVQAIYNKFGNESVKHPLCRSLYWLDSLIKSECSTFKELLLNIESQSNIDDDLISTYNTQVKSLADSMLLSIQNLYKKYNNIEKDTSEEANSNVKGSEELVLGTEDDDLPEIEKKHLKELIHNQLNEDINILNLPSICNRLEVLIQTLITTQETSTATYEISLKSLLRCLPLLEQLSLLSQFYLTQQVAEHRLTCKMLSVLLNIFMELTTKGFCVPPDLLEEDGQTDGVGNQSGGLGLGDGEGQRDVSDRIENEDQLDDAQPEGQEKEKDDDKDCKEEEKGIEMSEDFDSKLQDVESKDDENDSEKEEDDTDADKQMGETETGADKLDEQIWGSDNEEEAEEDQNEDASDGTGKETGEKEMTAGENQPNSAGNEEEAEPQGESEENKKDKQKKDIDKMEEPETNDDQIDPYHGNMEPPPEPEVLDLPDDMQLDEGEAKPEQDGNEENPFDIDAMKEQMPPPEQQEETDDKDDKTNENEDSTKMDYSDSSDEEDNTVEDKPDDQENKEEDTAEDENKDSDTATAHGEENNQKDEEEQQIEEDKHIAEQKASASKDAATDQPEAEAMETGEECSADQVQSNTEKTQNSNEESEPKEKTEKDAGGDGEAENKDPESGHQGDATSNQQVTSQKESSNRIEKKESKRKPGETDSERTLGEANEPLHKKLKTVDLKNESDSKEEKEEDGIADEAQEKSAELYKHIKDAKSSDTQMLDAATAEQAEENPVPNENPDDGAEDLKDDDVEMQEDENDTKEEMIEQLNSDKVEEASLQDKVKKNKSQAGDPRIETENTIEVEGEKVLTMTAERQSDSSYHTSHDVLKDDFNMEMKMSMTEIQEVKNLVNQKLFDSSQVVDSSQNSDWDALWWRTSNQARDLCEQLRLVLEPTLTSRLKGDYRSGRRINMRKVIPYVASEFRKDKIWLRRTKPSKREYRIIIAIDDSSSMDGNHSTELACESLALVSQALSLLETGDLSVISFGESPKILHPFGQPFTSQNGAKIMNELTFKQSKSRFAELLNFSGTLFRDHSSGNGAELLVIVSDGRISSEGDTVVRQAVRRLRQAGIFIVFLIIDNKKSNNSLVDTRVPIFNDKSQLVGMKWAMDLFPFPFYLFLRDLNSLPTVLSDALRQWFELVSNTT